MRGTPSLLSICVLCAGLVHPSATKGAPGLSWLSKRGIEIRQSYEGTSGESKPARIFWAHDANADNKDYYQIDLALLKRIRKDASGTSLRALPIIEWHRSTKTEKLSDQLIAKLQAEMMLFSGFTPHVIASAAWNRDLKMGTAEAVLSALLTAFSPTAPFAPGRNLHVGSTAIKYYPYLGYEYRDFDSPARNGNAHFFLLRAYLEAFPFEHILGIQVVVDYTHRFTGAQPNVSSDGWNMFTASLNLFLDSSNSVALGWDYIKGEDPSMNFVEREVSTVSLKLKI